MSAPVEPLKFLTEEQVVQIAATHELPVFVYSETAIAAQIKKALAFPVNEGFGLTVRFAMKANPNRSILKLMQKHGVHVDASSEFEAFRALAAGYDPSWIQLTAQEQARNLKQLVQMGVKFNACSLKQLQAYGELFPNTAVSIRLNPGKGSGATMKMDVGGAHSSFGIWHDKINDIKDIAQKYNLTVRKVHTHIGSGSDPEVWKAVADVSLSLAAQFEHVETINLGGGFKVARMADEKSTDLQAIGEPIKALLRAFADKHGRKLHLEIEPGSFYMVNSGSLLAEVDDVVDTGAEGHRFVKVNTGMDAITRPSLYGARHPMVIVPRKAGIQKVAFASRPTVDYIVVGHCCETGDMLTQDLGGTYQKRTTHAAQVGDVMVIEGAGAYCAGMCAKNYNSFPELAEVLLLQDGTLQLIRKRQTLEQIFQNEVV